MQSFDTLHQANDVVNAHIQIATGAPHGFNRTMQQGQITGFTPASHIIQPEEHPLNVASIGVQQ
jgi:hypothetical protein